MTALEALMHAEQIVTRNAADAARRDILHKLRTGHKFAMNYGRKLVNERALGKFIDDPEMDSAISTWLYLSAQQDRKAAERAEAFAAPIVVDQYTHLHADLLTLAELIAYERPAHLIRAQFEAWVISTKARRQTLEGSRRRSLAGIQGAFQRRLRKYERISLQRAGVCP